MTLALNTIGKLASPRARRAMWLTALLPLSLLAACNQISDRVSTSAESTRSATEKMASAARADAKKREARIETIAEPVREKNALVVGERFILRPEGTGWTVVDLQTGEPATIAGTKLTGLDLATAQKTIEDIHADVRERAAH